MLRPNLRNEGAAGERGELRVGAGGCNPGGKLGNRGGFRFKREDLERFLENWRNEGA